MGRYTSVQLLLPTTTEELLPLLYQPYCFVGRDHSAVWLCYWCASKLLILRKKQFVNSIVLCLQLRICILRCVFPQWQRSGENTQPDWWCCRPGRWSRRKIFTGAVCLSVCLSVCDWYSLSKWSSSVCWCVAIKLTRVCMYLQSGFIQIRESYGI